MSSSPSELTGSGVHARGHLLRILGVGFGIAVIVGGTVGSGILLTPGEIAGQLRNSWVILAVWVMGGVFAFFCTQALVELGTALPLAGGWLVYSRRAFGEYGGFLVGCCDWMVESASVAYLAAAFGEFAAQLQPALRGHEKLASLGCLLAIALLNWIGLRSGSRTQQITSLAKCLALMAFVAACFLIKPPAPPAHAAVQQSLLHLGPAAILIAIVAALQPVIATYDGWYSAIYFTEEDTDPARSLPRSSLIGILACAAVYLLVNAALLHILPVDKLAASRVPVADAAALLIGARARIAILLLSILTVVSCMNAVLMISPRILFAMARDGLMPRWITAVNRGGTPSGALLVSTLASIALVLSGSFDTLIAMTSVLMVALYLSGFLSLFILRIREPGLPRPFKMWGYPWTNLGITLGCGAFLIAAIVADLKHALFALAVIAFTYPLYAMIRAARRARAVAPAGNQLVPNAEQD